ncbi:MAG: SPOR domain-containing protein [Litoreibacter sp.]|nr:SPOR domain-containing protein [Litoreibacter sp.]
MADVEFDTRAAHGTPADGGLTSGIIHWFGALSSIALIAGLAIWGYELTVRDAGSVPVVKALEGPSRVQPEDPGGQLASHQGLAVNNVQSEGEAEGPAPQIVLAPSPVDLAQSDIIVGAAPAPELGASSAAALNNEIRTEPIGTLNAALADAKQPKAPAIVAPEPIDLGAAAAPAVAAEPAPMEAIALSVRGVNASPRPGLRPQVAQVRFDQSEAVSAAVASALGLSSVDLDPGSLEPGTRLVQLGAYDSREEAVAAWDKIALQFDDYMDDKKRVVQETQSGGRSFFRLRAAGFDGLSSSRRFCAVLVAEGAGCIPILSR